MTPRSTKSSKRTSGKRASGKRAPSTASTRKANRPGEASRGAPATSKSMSSKTTRSGTSSSGKSPDTSMSGKGSHPGSERARDEQRADHTPRYGGGPWDVADERGEARFGHARNDNADPSELAPREADNNDDDSPSPADPELEAAEAAGEIESSGQHAGMRRGDKPRKTKDRER